MSWSIIHTYTLARALADGVLIAVPADLAGEAGLRLPIACTPTVWDDCVAWTVADTACTGALQDETGRLWDLLTRTARPPPAPATPTAPKSCWPACPATPAAPSRGRSP